MVHPVPQTLVGALLSAIAGVVTAADPLCATLVGRLGLLMLLGMFGGVVADVPAAGGFDLVMHFAAPAC